MADRGRLVGAHLIVLAGIEEWNQNVREHVASQQDTAVGKEHRDVAEGVRPVLDQLARHRPAVRRQRRDQRDEVEGDWRTQTPSSLRPHSEGQDF